MEFKIFLTNLGKYNEGELVGKWVDLPCADLKKELAKIGVDGNKYGEYFITDYDCSFDYARVGLGEYESLNYLNKLAEKMEEVDDASNLDWALAYQELAGVSLMDALEDFEDCSTWYGGMTLLDVAYDYIDDCYDMPEFAKRYFDYEAFARDLGYDGYTEFNGGTICLC